MVSTSIKACYSKPAIARWELNKYHEGAELIAIAYNSPSTPQILGGIMNTWAPWWVIESLHFIKYLSFSTYACSLPGALWMWYFWLQQVPLLPSWCLQAHLWVFYLDSLRLRMVQLIIFWLYDGVEAIYVQEKLYFKFWFSFPFSWASGSNYILPLGYRAMAMSAASWLPWDHKGKQLIIVYCVAKLGCPVGRCIQYIINVGYS